VTPSPLIIVVWESVPTTLSGYSKLSVSKTTRARYSRFTWWGGEGCAWMMVTIHKRVCTCMLRIVILRMST
jgi:hypothetical protein